MTKARKRRIECNPQESSRRKELKHGLPIIPVVTAEPLERRVLLSVAALPNVLSTASSNPNDFVITPTGVVFFAAANKLWKTDATAAGTVALMDFGSSDNAPTNLFVCGTSIYFSAGDSASGRELWMTDGTTAGTQRIKDISPGSGSSSPSPIAALGNTLIFSADDGSNGIELWKSDGTAVGTSLIKDIYVGAPSSTPYSFAVLNGVVLFTAYDLKAGRELWRTDGTTGGTFRIKDIRPGPEESAIGSGHVFDGLAYFFANDGVTGSELYRTDGTTAGTTRVFDLNPGAASSGSSDIVDHGGKLYFSAETPATGRELWSYDPAADDAELVVDLRPGPNSSFPGSFDWMGDELFFLALDDSGINHLWRSDGTAAGTNPILGDNSFVLGEAGGKVFFFSSETVHGRELWAADDPLATPYLVKDINVGPQDALAGSALNIIPLGSDLLFTANDGLLGNELWISDGTAAGTHILKDLNTTSTPRVPTTFIPFKGVIYFTTAAGGLFAADEASSIVEKLSSVSPGSFAVVGDWLYFTTGDNSSLPGIWRTDGTVENTRPVQEFPLTGTTGFIRNIFAYGGKAYFSWGAPGVAPTLWTTDGTSAGTQPIFDLTSPVKPLYPQSYRAVGNQLYFIAQTTGAASLWVTDGTIAGTHNLGGGAIASIGQWPETPKTDMEVLGGSIAFTGSDSSVWLGDATHPPAQLRNADGSSIQVQKDFRDLTNSIAVLNGSVYFLETDGLWKTDGGTAGATRVATTDGDVYPTFGLMRAGGHLFFFDQHGGESEFDLWSSDGTAAGTQLIRRFYTTHAQGYPIPISTLVDFNGVAYFSANDPASGIGDELWRSDGTMAGTAPAADLLAGAASSDPTQLTPDGDALYLIASGASGSGIWKVSEPAKPLLPANVSVTVLSAFRVQVKWDDDNAEESGYRIERSLNSDFSSIDDSFVAAINSTSFIDPVAIPGTTYWYRVVAYNSAGEAASNGVQVTTPQPSLATGLKLIDTSPSQTLGWFTWQDQAYSIPAVNLFQRSDGDVLETISTSGFFSPTPLKNRLYGLNMLNGRGQLVVSDGTAGNTSVIAEVPGRVQKLTAFEGKLYFVGASGPNFSPYDTLYVSDGTQAGTHPLDRSAITDTRLQFLVNWIFFTTTGIEKPLDIAMAGNDLYYIAATPTGNEVFRTDGSNTFQLTDSANFAGPLNADPQMLTYLDGYVYFYGTPTRGNNDTRFPLWRTDGTYEGTTRVNDVDLGDISNFKLIRPVEANGTIFFGGNKQLWATDGTDAGALLVDSQQINELSVVNGRLYFSTTVVIGTDQYGDPILQGQLWTSNGTQSGTAAAPGMTAAQNAFDMAPYYLATAGGSVVFFGDPHSDIAHLPFLYSYTPPAVVLQKPAAPTGLQATADSATQVTLTWHDLASIEEGYVLERSLDPNFGSIGLSIRLPSNVEHYVDMDLIGGTAYYYRVYAFNSGGNSALATIGPVTTQPSFPAPTDFRAVEGLSGERVDLSWTDNAGGETGYIVERSSNEDFFPSSTITLNVTLGPNANLFSDSSVTRFSKYYYRVFAVGPQGNSGAALLTITTGEARPAAPSGLVAAGVSNSDIDIQWVDNSINEGTSAGFEVERAEGAGPFEKIATLAANVTFYSDTSLTAGQFYTYRVRAINVAGASDYTLTAQARTLPPVLTSEVVNLPPYFGSIPHADFLTTAGNLVYFVSSPLLSSQLPVDAGGTELWVTDGTPAGTTKLFTGRGVRQLINVNGTLYFVADNALYKTGGNVGGVQKVFDQLVPGQPDIRTVAALGDELFFTEGSDTSGVGAGYRLWKTDGTAAGTFELVGHTVFFANAANAPVLARVSGRWLYFMDGINYADSTHGGNLWRTDGTATQEIAGISMVQEIESVGDTIYAVGAVSGQSETGLFTVDPNSVVANPVKVLDSTYDETPVLALTKVGQKVFFSFFAPNDPGWVVYVSDGTAGGTHVVFDPVNDIGTDSRGRAYKIVDIAGEAFILSSDVFNTTAPGSVGYLWKSDGTPQGTQRVRSVTSDYSIPIYMTEVAGKLVYSDGSHLWQSDGTFDGTMQITWIATSSDGQRSSGAMAGAQYAVLGNQILYTSPIVGGGRDLRLATLVAPAAPDGLVVSNGASPAPAGPAPAPLNGVLLTWVDHSNSETGFMIERSRTPDFAVFDSTFFVPANFTSFVDKTASPEVRFYYRIRAVNAGGESASSNLSSLGAPVVTSAIFDYAHAPQSIIFAFSSDIGASLSSAWTSGAAGTLTNLTTGENIDLAQVHLSYSQANQSAVLSFAPGVLLDGRYRLQLDASAIHGATGLALDGNQDGTGGDNFVFEFFQLSGDVDRDAKVSFSDLVTIAQRYGQSASSYAEGDLNGDGMVSFADLVAVAQNYDKALSMSPLAVGSAESLASVSPATRPSLSQTSTLSVPSATRARNARLAPIRRRSAVPPITRSVVGETRIGNMVSMLSTPHPTANAFSNISLRRKLLADLLVKH